MSEDIIGAHAIRYIVKIVEEVVDQGDGGHTNILRLFRRSVLNQVLEGLLDLGTSLLRSVRT